MCEPVSQILDQFKRALLSSRIGRLMPVRTTRIDVEIAGRAVDFFDLLIIPTAAASSSLNPPLVNWRQP